jgi:hypothetical protein
MNRIGIEVFKSGFESGFNSKGPDNERSYAKDKERKERDELLRSSGRSPIRGSEIVGKIERAISGKSAEQKALLEKYVSALKVVGHDISSTEESVKIQSKLLLSIRRYQPNFGPKDIMAMNGEISSASRKFREEIKKRLEQDLGISVDKPIN